MKQYEVGAWITAVLVFIGCWIYCIATYGFLLGVGLGWLPSLITACVVAPLWPLAVIAAAIFIIPILKSYKGNPELDSILGWIGAIAFWGTLIWAIGYSANSRISRKANQKRNL